MCNRDCYWNMDGYCVSENAEVVYEDGTFQTNDCIGFLREDMEEHMNKMKLHIMKWLRDLSYSDTLEIYNKIIESRELI